MSGRVRPALSLPACRLATAAAAAARCRRPACSPFSTSTAAAAALPVRNVVVVGSGLMGAGIAHVAAQSGFSVTMCDVSPELVKKGEAHVLSSLGRAAKKAHPDDAGERERLVAAALANLKTSADSAAAARDADLVIEAVVEDLAQKQELFARLDAAAPPRTVFATNTSSLPVAAIAARVRRGDRFGGLHFFNPVPQMRLVEVVRTADTSEDTYDTLMVVSRQMKKTPVTCKDTPGFIVNRLLVPYMIEAVRMHERGEASKEDIDTAMKLGAGYPMGPFELMDYVGLDTTKFILDGWFKNGKGLKGQSLVAPSPMLDKLVEEKNFGRKAGKGFYQY